jgi:hypothetical protein
LTGLEYPAIKKDLHKISKTSRSIELDIELKKIGEGSGLEGTFQGPKYGFITYHGCGGIDCRNRQDVASLRVVHVGSWLRYDLASEKIINSGLEASCRQDKYAQEALRILPGIETYGTMSLEDGVDNFVKNIIQLRSRMV